MSHEIEILSALETQNFALTQLTSLLESILEKLSSIDGTLDSLTGYGTDTIHDLKSSVGKIRIFVEQMEK